MKITMITGSAHKTGTSAYLSENFAIGAQDAGHEVERFDAAFLDVHACIGCGHCRSHAEKCIFQDDMNRINQSLIEADAVVFASPVYYNNISAQMKAVIDRFYAVDEKLKNTKKAVLLLTSADEEWENTAGPILAFKGMCDYLGWSGAGIITAGGCAVREDIEKADFGKKAYELGKKIGM